MSTNIKESGFEELFTEGLVENGYIQKDYNGQHKGDYDVKECIDTIALWNFLESTQSNKIEKLEFSYGKDYKTKFLQRLQKEISEKGIIEVLRKGVKDRDVTINLMYFKPNSSLNEDLEKQWKENIFIVTRQLHYSLQNQNSLDMVILINGLPIITLELKNLLSSQNVWNAISQYQKDRSSREKLFAFGRCIVHFAADTELVYMTTHLQDGKTWFLPFNKGYNSGAGNPPSKDGIKTDYMRKHILKKSSLSRIISDFVQLTSEKKNGKESKKLIFPRYHQLDVVNNILKDVKQNGVGKKYLIQHSAGSGKSNSISWLAHQLASLFMEDGKTHVFNSILVITDRRVLDKQLRNIISTFDHVKGLIQAVTDGSKQLKEALENEKKVIVTTIQKFPFISDSIKELGNKKFAIIIDEAHSSTGGETMGKLNATFRINSNEEENASDADIVLENLQARKLLENASYFAFTATPKNKTLELFGTKNEEGKFHAFHEYTMKQAIEEGFILDVLGNYTTYNSYNKIAVRKNDEELYDKRDANKQMFSYVQNHNIIIEKKAKEMIEHFNKNIFSKYLVGGKAKAMVVCGSRKNAVQYGFAFKKIISEKNYPFGVIVAFSGDVEIDGITWNESKINKFSSNEIPEEFENGQDEKGNEYKFLICADKFQTGFDQPLLQTMYVDKKLGGVNAVQTLSRLNRTHRDKESTFVLDFKNTDEEIKKSFEPYYKTTILSQESDPNKLNDLKDQLDSFHVYDDQLVKEYTTNYYNGVKVEKLHPILDKVVEQIKLLDKEEILNFKDKLGAYTRFYSFISQIITYEKSEYEELYVFLKHLNKKIVGLGGKENIISQDILDSIDFDSYKLQKEKSNIRIILNEAGELAPNGVDGSGGKTQEGEKDTLVNIVKSWNDKFGTNFTDEDKIKDTINNIANEIASDPKMKNSIQADPFTRKLEFTKIITSKISENVDTNLELYKHYSEDDKFQTYIIEHITQSVLDTLRKII